jgi:very-short-patch-repair endonuclease
LKELPIDLKYKSRILRKNQTDAEKFLWSRIRDRRLVDFKFRRQFVIGRYIVDFYCLRANLIIELDGGQHNFDGNILKDEIRDAWLRGQGNTILRFWNNEVFANTEAVLETIRSHCVPSPLIPLPKERETN